MAMTTCRHYNLVLLPREAPRLRCRHCHLTLSAEELGEGPCPECLDATGQRRYDFDPLATASQAARYRCEDCGALVADGGPDDSP